MIDNLIQVLKAVPPGKKISFIMILAMVVGGFIALMVWTNRPDFQVLFSNLETSDASKISEKLREKRVPFELRDGGRAVLVPNEMVYQLRLEMASEGIPQGGTVGFEVFDNITFGTTEFVQRLKYQQALQGELARTIMGFDSIANARVHIVTAGDSLFAEPEKPATASVVIRAHGGRKLDQRQVQGIINLVASAVEGLKPDNVSIVDMSGGILSKGDDEGGIGNMTMAQFDYQQKLEKTFEKRIMTMLEPVVGMNKVVARVSVEVDFRQVNVSEEQFDPESVVIRSEQRQKESSTDGNGTSSGSPDMQYQVYGNDAEGATSSRVFNKENAIINYEINKINRSIINTAGDIKRLSTAVIIDGPYVTDKDTEGNDVLKFTPRSRKEMKEFEEIIKKAIGFAEARGDQVNVSNIAFSMQEEAIVPVAEGESQWIAMAKKGSKVILNILAVLLFFLFVIKPFKKWLSQTREYVNTMKLREGEAAPAIEAPYSDEMMQSRNNKQKLIDATMQNPDAAADIVRHWINEVS